MALRLNIRVYEDRQLAWSDDFEGPGELGRQERGEAGPFACLQRPGRWRLVVARSDENDVGRRHVLLEPLPGSKVRLRNGSTGQPIRLLDGQEVPPGASCELALPMVLTLGRKAVRLQEARPEGPLHTLAAATLPPRPNPGPAALFPGLARGAATPIDSKELVEWLHGALDVLQAAADSADFFDRAAAAAAAMSDLDSAQVLLLEGGNWRQRALRLPPGSSADLLGRPSRYILTRVRQEKRTLWEVLGADAPEQKSLAGVEAVVAAPILDREGEVIGALYGERRQRGASPRPLSEVEAMLVELLARGVAAGLARLEQEKAVLAERVRFEQFFTPELSRQLARQPDLLLGRDTEVSVLFADVRGFSRISQRLGPAGTVEWVRDVFDALSASVLDEGGVLVNYIGDELMAMWGAPEAQPDHARRACRAALAMLERLPELDERWRARLGEPLAVGIGINSGRARVGNTGSRHRFQYGPLGGTVNLASRIQGATKYLKCPLLITGATQAQLDAGFSTRRLGRVQVVNIAESTDVFELVPAGAPGWPEARSEYEQALNLFEKGQFDEAARLMGTWRVGHPEDGPALLLLHRAVCCQVEGAPPSHAVWSLTEK
jgi:adenylate cyclase